MSEKQGKEAKLAETIVKLFKILNVTQIPEAIIEQIAFRMSAKNSNSKSKLTKALTAIGVEPKKTFEYPDVIQFDVKNEGGNIIPKESFNLDGHTFQLSIVNQNLFTVAEECLQPVLGIISKNNLRSSSGFGELHKCVDEFLSECSKGDKGRFNPNDSVTNYFKNICNSAQRNILGKNTTVNAENVKKYLKYLDIQESLLPFQQLGNLRELKEASTLLEVPFIAEKIIKIIGDFGFIYEESIAIYNKNFGCSYEPIMGISVTCATCYQVSRFDNVKKTEKCVCGKPLFDACKRRKCGALSPRIVDICPECGSRKSDALRFTNAVASAKSFVKNGNIERAEECLAVAQNIAPERISELEAIFNEIKKIKKTHIEISRKIDELINRRMFFKAAELLSVSKKDVPYELIKSAAEQITTAKNESDSKFISVKNDAVGLQKVLAICKDHPGAIECLGNIKPIPPKTLTVRENGDQICIAWDASTDIGVEYQWVRNSYAQPQNAFDGDKYDITDELSVKDNSPIPGKLHYAVYAKRGKSLSEVGVQATIVYLPEVSNFSIRQLKDCVEISYRIPQNTKGVRIERSINKKRDVIYTGMNTTFIDTSNCEKCSYTIFALYDKRESKGTTIEFTASDLPKEIKPQVQTNQNDIEITWNTSQNGFMVKVFSIEQPNFSPKVSDFYGESDFIKNGREITSVRSEETSVNFKVRQNMNYNLAVLVGNSNGFLCCGIFQIYAGVFPKIKKVPYNVGLNGEHFFLFEDSLPAKVSGFAYAVSKTNQMPPQNEFINGNMIGYAGLKKPMIKVPNLVQSLVGRCYIFCRFTLSDGKETTPICSEVHFKQNIQVQVNLKIRGLILRVETRLKLCRYDFIGHPTLPQLNLQIGENKNAIKKVEITPTKMDYVSITEIQLLSPIYNMSEIKLVPEDSKFINDFVINYKY